MRQHNCDLHDKLGPDGWRVHGGEVRSMWWRWLHGLQGLRFWLDLHRLEPVVLPMLVTRSCFDNDRHDNSMHMEGDALHS